MWDKRYDTKEYVYGIKPNNFLVENIKYVMPGKVVCLAEGEGRNSVFLARNGYQVIAVDSSAIGLKKAQTLAKKSGVSIDTVVSNLTEYQPTPQSLSTVISIFCHLPKPMRVELHNRVMEGLKPGGTLLLEAYTPEQLKYGTGGPPTKELMMSLEELKDELKNADFLLARETKREIIEGTLHTGIGAVVQIIARKK